MADAVIREDNQPSWFLKIKISEIGLNERQVAKNPSPLGSFAALCEHCGRSINADNRTSAARRFDRDTPIADTQLDDRAVSGKILLDIEREVRRRRGGRSGPNRVDVSKGIVFGFGFRFGFGNLVPIGSIWQRHRPTRIPAQQNTCDSP